MKTKTKTIFFFISLVAIGLICLPVKTKAQNGINGTVFDNERRPVGEIEVELLDEYERLIRSVKTRSGGLYFFNNLRAGVFYVQIRTGGTGFAEYKNRVVLGDTNRTRQTSTGVTVSGIEIKQENIYLQLDRRSKRNYQVSSEVLFVQEVPKDAEEAYKRGVNYASKKETDLAVPELIKAVDLFPDYYLALINLGKIFVEKSEFEKAELSYERAVSVNKKSAEAFFGLAIAQNSLAKKAEAEANLLKAIELNSNNTSYYLLLGIIQRNLKKYLDAEKSLLKAEAISESKEPDVHWQIASLYYYDLNRPAEAAKHLEKYLKVAPSLSREKKDQIKKLIIEIKASIA
jgi:cytochrome c-type biogenesis protein CcmH/NrfG